MQALIADRLSITRGDRTLLSDLGFAVGAGEVLHLHGPNGSGKTSLLEVLAGLREPAQGELRGAPEPGGLHWLGAANALHGALSPRENLEFWCGLNGASEAAIEPALRRLEVHRERHRACRTLSTGQRRRVALARLLLAQHAWWLLDEPLNGLDAAGTTLFAGLLREHLAQGGAAIVTSHQSLPAGIPAPRVLELGR